MINVGRNTFQPKWYMKAYKWICFQDVFFAIKSIFLSFPLFVHFQFSFPLVYEDFCHTFQKQMPQGALRSLWNHPTPPWFIWFSHDTSSSSPSLSSSASSSSSKSSHHHPHSRNQNEPDLWFQWGSTNWNDSTNRSTTKGLFPVKIMIIMIIIMIIIIIIIIIIIHLLHHVL